MSSTSVSSSQATWVPPCARWVAIAVVVCMPGCGDEDERASGLDASVRADLDAEVTGSVQARDSGRNPDGAGPNVPPTHFGASPAACVEALLPASSSTCGTPDETEPSSRRAPATLLPESTCALVSGRAADKEDDAYRFATMTADPVLLELAHQALGRAELRLSVYDLAGRELARQATPPGDALRSQQLVFLPGAGMQYDVRVEGDLLGTCLPYALRVSPRFCSDAYEDNDSEGRAHKLVLDINQSASLVTSISQGDADFYELSTPRADPVRISGTYTVTDGDTLQLRRVLSNTSGLGAIDVAGQRVGASESFSHWLLSNTAGAVFRAQLSALGTGCAQLSLRFEAAACTDSFEDNDTLSAPAPLVAEQLVSATSFRGDDDYYDLSRLPSGGTCTVRYASVPGRVGALRLQLFQQGSGSVASEGESSGGDQKTVRLSFASGTASALLVRTSRGEDCLPYTLRCTSEGAPPQ